MQRYVKKFLNQNASFAAKVFFFDQDETLDILKTLLAKYFRAANKEKESKDEEDEFDERSSNVEAFGDMRDTVTALMAMFRDSEGFETEENAHAYLKRAKSETDERLLFDLLERAKSAVNEALDGHEAVTFEYSTADRLLYELQPYTFQVNGIDGEGQTAPWPLVSRIDFGLDHPLLNEGIVFVDSPGLSDANAARSRNAIKYHRTCTHKIAVAEIGRAEADLTLRKVLENAYQTRGSGKALLVLTHADTIDPETEVIGTPLEKKRLAKLDADIKLLRDQRKKKQQERQRARLEDRDDFDEKLRSIGKDLNKFGDEKNTCRLEMRNRKVVRSLQDIYRKLTQDPRPLYAFAVGNKVYQEYQAGFNEDNKPSLSVK